MAKRVVDCSFRRQNTKSIAGTDGECTTIIISSGNFTIPYVPSFFIALPQRSLVVCILDAVTQTSPRHQVLVLSTALGLSVQRYRRTPSPQLATMPGRPLVAPYHCSALAQVPPATFGDRCAEHNQRAIKSYMTSGSYLSGSIEIQEARKVVDSDLSWTHLTQPMQPQECLAMQTKGLWSSM